MDLPIFDQVGELVRAMADDAHGTMYYRAHGGGVKVWFGSKKPLREHYEAQFIPRHLVDGKDGAALEIGFHAEHRDLALNEEVMARLMKKKASWSKSLGKAAKAGGFLGRPDDWRRVSETWVKFTFEDPDIAFEMASRLVDYVDALEPHRT